MGDATPQIGYAGRDVSGTTVDGFLGGRVSAQQPHMGFRSGLDAVILAASVPAHEGDHALELGCGAGIASLCLAARVTGCAITGVDSEAGLVALAAANAAVNGLGDRLSFVAGDALALSRELRRDFDHVFLNPPFHDSAGQRPLDRERAVALHDEGKLSDWVSAAQRRVRSGGSLTVIVRTDRLPEVLRTLPDRGLVLFPLWPRDHEPARRVVVQARKDARAPLQLLPGLVLHASDGCYTPAAEAVLKEGAALALANRPL